MLYSSFHHMELKLHLNACCDKKRQDFAIGEHKLVIA